MTVQQPPPEAKIVVVIPAYRAEKHILTVLQNIPAIVAHIIVVDDASPDNLATLVENETRRDPRISLVRLAQNMGVGGSMLNGYAAALELHADIIVKMDSDDQMDPAYLPALIAPIVEGKADYTKGNRFLHARQLLKMPLKRRLGNLGLSFLSKAASGYWNIFDTNNGYTAIHASLVPKLDQSAIDRRFFFETSLLMELNLLGAVVKDVYIPARYQDESSNLSEMKMFFYFPPRLMEGLLRRLWTQYFLRDFNICSILLSSGSFLFVFGLIFGLYHWIKSALLNILTPTGTIMVAVLPVILGVQFLVQAVTLDVQNIPHEPIQNADSRFPPV